MLALDQEAKAQSLRGRRLDIKMKEMKHYTKNLGMIAKQCSMLGGFSFNCLTRAKVIEIRNLWGTGGHVVATPYEGATHVCELFYIYCAILSMMFNLCALSLATFASMLG